MTFARKLAYVRERLTALLGEHQAVAIETLIDLKIIMDEERRDQEEKQ